MLFVQLFGWTDRNWHKDRKVKYFQFSPRPTSARLLRHWGHIARQGQIIPMPPAQTTPTAVSHIPLPADPSFDESDPVAQSYELSNLGCPVLVVYGGEDKLVHGKRLVEDMRARGAPLAGDICIAHHEHMDLIWAIDAPACVYEPMLRFIQDHM
jgi:pimeloyl-ACP methyl ester carboxylesterase